MQTVDAAGLPVGDGHPSRIMGVLNVSKESPYAPSVFAQADEAARYVDEELIGNGAEIVDIGLESANKRFDVLPPAEELDRLQTAIETIESVSTDAVFSIETRYHEVADAALDGGFDMVNDICGFADPEMPRVCEEHDAAVIKMASPPDIERPGALESVDEIYEALKLNGFTEKTIIDPAFGGWISGKTLEDDRETFRRLREFRGLDRPILVSINRKNFLRELAGRSTKESLPVSLAATSMAVERGAHIIRTHDVRATRDAAIIGDAFSRKRFRNRQIGIEELDVRTPRETERHLERIGADAACSDQSVIRAFELSELSREDHKRITELTEATGVTCAVGEEGGLLMGTPQNLLTLREADLTPRLESAVGSITERLQQERDRL